MVHYERSGDDIDRGLVGYWKLDDLKLAGVTKAIDRANFNDGTITGATNTEGVNGLNPDAMFFDGVDDSVITTNNLITGNMPFSISFLMKFSTAVSQETMIVLGFGGTGTKFRIKQDFLSGNLRLELSSGGNKRMNGTINDDKWHNIIITFDETNIEDCMVYLDNIEDTEESSNSDAMNISSDGGIAFGESDTGSLFYNGNLSSIRVYNRVLTAGERSKIVRLKL